MVKTYNWSPNSFLVLVRIVLSKIGAYCDVDHKEGDHDYLVESDKYLAPLSKAFAERIVCNMLKFLTHQELSNVVLITLSNLVLLSSFILNNLFSFNNH